MFVISGLKCFMALSSRRHSIGLCESATMIDGESITSSAAIMWDCTAFEQSLEFLSIGLFIVFIPTFPVLSIDLVRPL